MQSILGREIHTPAAVIGLTLCRLRLSIALHHDQTPRLDCNSLLGLKYIILNFREGNSERCEVRGRNKVMVVRMGPALTWIKQSLIARFSIVFFLPRYDTV